MTTESQKACVHLPTIRICRLPLLDWYAAKSIHLLLAAYDSPLPFPVPFPIVKSQPANYYLIISTLRSNICLLLAAYDAPAGLPFVKSEPAKYDLRNLWMGGQK